MKNEIFHQADTNTVFFRVYRKAADAAISAVERWIANDLGITPWW